MRAATRTKRTSTATFASSPARRRRRTPRACCPAAPASRPTISQTSKTASPARRSFGAMTIYPSLRYRDARAAIDWLAEAFGFEEHAVHADGEGIIRHAELRGFGGIVMLGTEPEGGDPYGGEHAGEGWLYLSHDDIDALHDRAVAAGAEIVRP